MAKDDAQIYISRVEKVIDDNDGLRIQARIPYYDSELESEELPFAFPLLPKFLHVNPKIGEGVLIITQNTGNPNSDRFFIGPLISQPYTMPYEQKEVATRLLNGASKVRPYPAVNMDDGNEGVLPHREDIAIEGRENTELVLKDEEIRLRCGYKTNPINSTVVERLHRNDINPAYIQMRYGILVPTDGKSPTNNGASSMINIVADKINLLSHNSGTYFNLHDKNNLISDDELYKIFANAHPIPYGDVLASCLKKLVDMFRTHHHTFAYKKPEFTDIENTELNKFNNLEQTMLSKNILVN